MDDEEFIHRRSHLASQNVMTADNPPADDVQAFEEQYVDQRTNELMEGLYNSPDRIQEYIMEGDYENTNLKLIFSKISDILIMPKQPKSITMLTINDIGQAMIAYLDEQVSKEARDHVENL